MERKQCLTVEKREADLPSTDPVLKSTTIKVVAVQGLNHTTEYQMILNFCEYLAIFVAISGCDDTRFTNHGRAVKGFYKRSREGRLKKKK